MKAILCKPNEKPIIVEIQKKHDYRDIKKLLGIESPLTCVSRKIGDKYYNFWCDDEGLLHDEKHITGCWKKCPNEIICGNILIADHNDMGEMKGLTNQQITEILNKKNWADNELFLSMYLTDMLEDYNIIEEIDKNGDLVIIEDYHGFGKVKMNRNGYLLRYDL